MSTHKHIDKICCVVLALTLILCVLFMNAEHFGIQKASAVMGYQKTLFDTSKVHTIDIIMDDWDEFTANCKSEEYYACTVVIDNEAYKNVAIRGKGNTSLSQVSNDRYSYKIEFDHYDSTNTYYGLDKLCLNNIIQDNTYMKDYLTYRMMNEMGVASPLCSYVYITVNGEDWGLYLAVEGVEESFLQRNYGKDYGELYKPDSQSMGGGRGNGEKFDMDEFFDGFEFENTDGTQNDNNNSSPFPQMPSNSASEVTDKNIRMPDINQGGQIPGGMQGGQMPDKMTPPDDFELPNGTEMPDNMLGNMGGGMTNGSDDVLLKYIDDNTDSYSNIFDNAKTDITEADKTRLINALKNLSNGEDLENTVDIDKVIRYFVVHNFVLNFDSYTGSMIHNYYLYENDGQMQMIPWDYNLAFGGFQSMGDAASLVNYPIDSPVSEGDIADRPMIAWIFENEEYTELYHQYFAEFISDYFDSGYFSEMIDEVNSMISPYVEKDPTKFCTYEEFKTGISTLKEFCLLRAESISGQLDGTIGSTSDTQTSDTLIDAGDILISDMGSMNNTMIGDIQKPQGETNTDEVPALSNGNENKDKTADFSTAIPDSSENGGDDDGSKPQMPEGDMQKGQMPNGIQGRFDVGQTQKEIPSDNADGDNGNKEFFDDVQMQNPDGNSRSNDNGQIQPQGQSPVSYLILIGITMAILIFGLVFAFKFKRRK